MTSLLGHRVVDDAQPASWQAVVARESWITGRAFPTSAYLAGAVAAVVVDRAVARAPVVPHHCGRRWPCWPSSAWCRARTCPLDLVVAFGVGVAGGSAALLVVGSPDLSPRAAAVAAALRRAGVGSRC